MDVLGDFQAKKRRAVAQETGRLVVTQLAERYTAMPEKARQGLAARAALEAERTESQRDGRVRSGEGTLAAA